MILISVIFRFGYKQKHHSPASLYSTVSPEKHAVGSPTTTTPTNTTTTTTIDSSTTFASSTAVYSTNSTTISSIIATTNTTDATPVADEGQDNAFRASEPEVGGESTTSEDAAAATTEQQNVLEYADESQTDDGPQPADEQPTIPTTTENPSPSVQNITTTAAYVPTLMQMHNQQQHEQLQRERDRQRHRHAQQQQQNDRADAQQQRNGAYAFESLEKAFATAVPPHKIRSTKDLQEQSADATADATTDQLPWSWAKDIMLQKPVLKKSSREIAWEHYPYPLLSAHNLPIHTTHNAKYALLTKKLKDFKTNSTNSIFKRKQSVERCRCSLFRAANCPSPSTLQKNIEDLMLNVSCFFKYQIRLVTIAIFRCQTLGSVGATVVFTNLMWLLQSRC